MNNALERTIVRGSDGMAALHIQTWLCTKNDNCDTAMRVWFFRRNRGSRKLVGGFHKLHSETESGIGADGA